MLTPIYSLHKQWSYTYRTVYSLRGIGSSLLTFSVNVQTLNLGLENEKLKAARIVFRALLEHKSLVYLCLIG